MHQNRIAHYTDFAAYPALIAVMILAIADGASPLERALALAPALAFALAGAFLWRRLEHLLHRSVPYRDTRAMPASQASLRGRP